MRSTPRSFKVWALGLMLVGCARGGVRPDPAVTEAARSARLEVKPTPLGRLDILPGRQPLELGGPRDGVMFVPRGYKPDRPAPLLVLLHGATSNGEEVLDGFEKLADEAGVVVVAPDSRKYTWDVVAGGLGPDVAFVERALERAFSRVSIDPARVAIAGFSDGGSYALTLGLANGDLFQHVLAFSPGFLATTQQRGAPRVFVAHGTADHILKIDDTARPIVGKLRAARYDVDFREFDGRHELRPDLLRQAFRWWLDQP